MLELEHAYRNIQEIFSIIELVVFRVTLLAFFITGVWRLLKREIAEARKPIEPTREIQSQPVNVSP